MTFRSWLIGIGAVLLCSVSAFAADVNARSIRMEGRSAARVTTARVLLGDIAEISSAKVGDDDAIIGLRKIEIEKSPAPGKTVAIEASHVLDRLSRCQALRRK